MAPAKAKAKAKAMAGTAASIFGATVAQAVAAVGAPAAEPDGELPESTTATATAATGPAGTVPVAPTATVPVAAALVPAPAPVEAAQAAPAIAPTGGSVLGLLVQAGGTPVPINVLELFDQVIENECLGSELANAYAYCQNLPKDPVGRASTNRPVSEILETATRNRGTLSHCYVSGALAQLHLLSTSMPDNVNICRIRAALAEIRVLEDIANITQGPIVINVDSFDRAAITMENVLRANKDAEVAALCLVLHWLQVGADVLDSTKLQAIWFSQDLVFDAQCLGQGSEFLCEVGIINVCTVS